MTAEEIRKTMFLAPRRRWWHRFGLTARLHAFYLMEIAAQLAELNEQLQRGASSAPANWTSPIAFYDAGNQAGDRKP
jgi:hypothetical protein